MKVYVPESNVFGDPSCRAVEAMGLRPLAYWDCGFQFRWVHKCLFLVSVVCCQVEVCAHDIWILRAGR
jgi:hypothetical protein